MRPQNSESDFCAGTFRYSLEMVHLCADAALKSNLAQAWAALAEAWAALAKNAAQAHGSTSVESLGYRLEALVGELSELHKQTGVTVSGQSR